ncbi:unnamed protein product [Paramecium sonneborni]|uniref:WD40-repeat-containing domain n=1 Tax=Paramecium sonneborni TaxID=65129 RepID=A0A8S1LAR2_9CILI|nr:unnamed protein product [Paramecium sonneborni]
MNLYKPLNQFNSCVQHNEKAIYLDMEMKENKRIFYCLKCIEKIKNLNNLLSIKDAEAFIQKNQKLIMEDRKLLNKQNLEVLLKLKQQLQQFQSKLSQYIEQNVQKINDHVQIIISTEESLELKIKDMLCKIIYENSDMDQNFEKLIDYQQIKESLSYSLTLVSNFSFLEEQQKFLKQIKLGNTINSLELIKDFFKNQQDTQFIRNQNCNIHQLQLDFIYKNQKNQYNIGCMKCDFENVIQKRSLCELKQCWDQFQNNTQNYVGFHQKVQSSLELLKQHKIAFIQIINQLNQLFDPNEEKIDRIRKKTFNLIKKDWIEMTTEDVSFISKILNDQNNQLVFEDTIQAEIEANQTQIRQFCQHQIQITDQIKYSYQFQNTNNQKNISKYSDSKSTQLIEGKSQHSGKQYIVINTFKEDECKALAFNQDSTIMIAGYFNGLINVYEFKLGLIKLVQQLNQHRNMITCLSFMKQSNGFVSGSKDMTIIIWMMKNNVILEVQRILNAHSDWIVCLIINNNDNLIISGSDDKSIKFWIKQNNWKHSQTLLNHNGRIRSLSLNQSQNQLISCAAQDDRILVYQSENNNTWILIQVIQQCGQRICFLNDYIFTVQQMKTQEMQIYELNLQNKLFYQAKNIYVQSGNGCDWLFPKQFIKTKQLLINKNGQNLNIIKLRNNGEIITEQSIDFQTYFFYGAVTDDGEYLVTWNAKTQEMQVRIYKE